MQTANSMDKWNAAYLPDFTVHGFHTGKLVDFMLSDGRELTGIYQGYGLFGKDPMYDWMAGEVHVQAWKPHTPPAKQEQP